MGKKLEISKQKSWIEKHWMIIWYTLEKVR